MKKVLFISFLLSGLVSYSQAVYENKSGIYSFEMPKNFISQASGHERNEFVFISRTDTTSLVVNVNDEIFDKKKLASFKKASDSEVESNYFKVLKNPKIFKRGELVTYPDRTIFFHVGHDAATDKENDYMLTYLFYNKGKVINFIFRTKERRLEKVLPGIEAIANSVKLL